MPSPKRCTYLRCESPPILLISPPYGRDWAGCAEHAPAMKEALAVGLPQSSQVTTMPLRHLRVVA